MKRKLFSLKEWLTLEDAAKHLSIVFGEEVTEADVLRLGLDGRLRLSVNFVNNAKARCGDVVSWDETDWCLVPAVQIVRPVAAEPFGKTITAPRKLADLLKGIPAAEREKYSPFLESLNIDGERFLTLSDAVTRLSDVWDLPMVGAERLDVEHQYQILTGGPSVTLHCLDGAFVEGRHGQMCQLQESWERNEYQSGSQAALKQLEEMIAAKNIAGDDREKLLNRHKEERQKFLEQQQSRSEEKNYYPSAGLPEDAVIVVRTEALRVFERSLDDLPSGAEDSEPLSLRAETTFLNTIGGLLKLMLAKTPEGKPQFVFNNQTAIISALLEQCEGKPGIAQRTLEGTFAAAKRSLRGT